MTQNLPAYLQQYEAPDVGAALSANLGSAMPPHVSIGGGRFTLIDAGNNEIPVPTFDPVLGVYLDACIVDVNNVMSRIYFSGPYDADAEGVRPDCWSDNGIGPSVSANSPQGATCQPDPERKGYGCFWSVWGSKINANGKKVPACSEKQKVALLIPGFPTLFLLAIPPNSHGPLREYVEKCKGSQPPVNMANLITRISFVPGVQGTLQFQPVSYISEDIAKLRQAAYAEKKTDALVGRHDAPRTAGMIAHQPTGNEQPTIQFSGQPAQPVALPAQGQTMQVQQTAPFASATPAPAAAQQPMMQTTPQGSPQWPNPSTTSIPPNTVGQGGIAPTASPSEPTRRRRRTAAEMAAAQPATGQPAPAAPQAPFPHPGQQTAPQGQFQPSTAPGALPGQLDAFGMGQGQPAGADPAIAAVLDNFFKG
jgi:hypothetical protein